MARKDRSTLAQRIRERRLALGLTQREVAGADFTRGFISQIENGLIDPSLKSLEVISERLGTSVSYFLADDAIVDTADVLSMLRRVATLREANELGEALEIAQLATELAANQSDSLVLARAQRALGWVQYYSHAYSDAANSFELASQTFQRAGDLLTAAKAMNSAGTSWHFAQKLDNAVMSYRTALKLLDDADENRDEHLRISVNLALAHFMAGDYEQALPLLQQTLESEKNLSDYYRLGDIHVAIGLIHKKSARFNDAITAYNRARSIYTGVPDKVRYAHATLNCGTTYAAKKDYQQARIHLEEALGLYESMQQTHSAANAHAELAHVAWQEGNAALANEHCNAALTALSDGRERGRMLLLHGRILEQQDDLTAALDSYTNGLNLLDKYNDPEATEACFALGNLLLRLGRAEDASVYLARAATFYRSMSH